MKKLNLFIAMVAIGILVLTSGCGTPATEPPEDTPESQELVEPVVTETETSAQPTTPPTEIQVEMADEAEQEPAPAETEPLTLTSPAFGDGEVIPLKHTCKAENVSPELYWSWGPADPASYVLLMYDPDAPVSLGASTELGFAHWIIFNMDPERTGLPEDVPCGLLEGGCQQGSNDFDQFLNEGATFEGGAEAKLTGYDGPCPPEEHTYVFELFAMDSRLDLPTGATLSEVLAAMDGHVLESAQLTGTFDPDQ